MWIMSSEPLSCFCMGFSTYSDASCIDPSDEITNLNVDCNEQRLVDMNDGWYRHKSNRF